MTQTLTTTPAAPRSPDADKPKPLLEVRNLKTYFPVQRGLLKSTVGEVRAVDDISFHVNPGETLGLVGESGCGKSTVGRTILRLIRAHSGEILYNGENLLAADAKRLKQLRREIQIIFQDPVGSLNPRMTIGNAIAEPILVHGLMRGDALRKRVAQLLDMVGLSPSYAQRYPHEFSGGQRQRIGIARALALNPRFLVCDEPVSALDVSIQSQILNLLKDLQKELGLSYLFIAHNLAVVEHFCDRIAVMYLGRIVEMGTRDVIYKNPLHPYTKALLSAAPMPDPGANRQRILLTGEIPSPIFMFKDADKPREKVRKVDMTPDEYGVLRLDRRLLLDRPPLKPVPDEPGHFVSCHDMDDMVSN